MDEYISKEAVVRYIKGYSEKELNWNHNFGMITSSVLDKVERALSEMPAADVQPVKHGKWIDNGIAYTCSECNSSVPKNIFIIGCDFEGCPYCFARMDGDNE